MWSPSRSSRKACGVSVVPTLLAAKTLDLALGNTVVDPSRAVKVSREIGRDRPAGGVHPRRRQGHRRTHHVDAG